MFSCGIIVADTHLEHLRGQANLKVFGQSQTTVSGAVNSNHFCSTCGSLMYRVSSAFPGYSALRLGTVDDFHLHETKLKPKVELFTKDRVGWFSGLEGAKQIEGNAYTT